MTANSDDLAAILEEVAAGAAPTFRATPPWPRAATSSR